MTGEPSSMQPWPEKGYLVYGSAEEVWALRGREKKPVRNRYTFGQVARQGLLLAKTRTHSSMHSANRPAHQHAGPVSFIIRRSNGGGRSTSHLRPS